MEQDPETDRAWFWTALKGAKTGWIPTIGLKKFIALFCAGQVLIVVVAFAWSDVSVQQRSRSTLNSTMHKIGENLERRHLQETTIKATWEVRRHLAQMTQCAEMLANSVRDQEISSAVQLPSIPFLHSLAVYFNVAYAYFGTRENLYVDVNRLPKARGERQQYTTSTNTFNEFPHNVTRHTDSTTLTFDLDSTGDPIMDSVREHVIGFNARLRPWYNTTRWTGKPTWIEPFLWLPDLMLGIDCCVPVYDKDSTRPKVDTKGGREENAVWNESLALVACCDNTLDGLSLILSNLGLGEGGIAFIVQAEGPSTDLLIAAAEGNKTLPIAAQELAAGAGQVNASSIRVQRLSTAAYPRAQHAYLGELSAKLRANGRKGWAEVGEVGVITEDRKSVV